MNEKFLVGSGCGDDIFDWQLATTGAYQYGLGIQRQATLQPGNGNNGFEGDNNENGFDFLPRSDPKFCNFTVIGTRGQGGTITVAAARCFAAHRRQDANSLTAFQSVVSV